MGDVLINRLVKPSNRPPVVTFSNNSQSLWLSLSRFSLTVYTIIQFLFFLLAFSRLCRAFLDQRRIELTRSDEHHYLHGIVWITTGIITGVIETIAGFVQVSFGVILARRILRLIARATLMFGLLKGCAVLALRLAVASLTALSNSLDAAENFEGLTDELRGAPQFSKSLSRMLGVNPQQTGTFRRLSQSYLEESPADGYASAEKRPREQLVTVHYEKGQAPFLQIRFSTLDFPAQAVLADTVQQKRRSLPGLIPGRANAGSSTPQHRKNTSDEMVAMRNALLDTPRAKSALVTGNGHVPPEWARPPERRFSRRESGGTISDNLSIVRDLERKFPNLPPRVTGKYRGSILGQNYEEDPFPVVGVSRQSSLRQDGSAHNRSEEGGTSVTLSPSDSIKRKPAPPLLDNIAHISDRRNRRISTWGGLAQNTVDHPVDPPIVSPADSNSPTIHSRDPTPEGEPSTPKSRRTVRDLIKRASRAVSDASIRSTEWLASASAPQTTGTALTAVDIEMYRRGNMGPGSARATPTVGDALWPGDSPLPKSRGPTDDASAHSKLSWPHKSDLESMYANNIHTYAH